MAMRKPAKTECNPAVWLSEFSSSPEGGQSGEERALADSLGLLLDLVLLKGHLLLQLYLVFPERPHRVVELFVIAEDLPDVVNVGLADG